ncbi:MAG: acetylornithine deacetylase [Caulobacter sp.]|nr:acetylornithine deacetylase [Caulobacter sp.]
MQITPQDRPVLDRIAADGGLIVQRAVDWSHVNSGSRNLAGLEAQRGLLADAFCVLPAAPAEVPLASSVEIAVDGREREQRHPAAIAVMVRPQAPVQVVLTGHYDTVYGAESPFQRVTTRPDGAMNGPGIADMKGGISVMLAALQAFEGHADAKNVGYRVLLSPDEEIGSIASGPVLAEFGALGHVGMTYEPAMSDGSLAGARKGSGNFHIVVHGKAAHAGRDFSSGRNAITAAARIAGALDGLNGRRDGVTVNVAKIDGGSPLNMVPDIAIVRFNVRFPDEAAGKWLEHALDDCIKVGNGEGLTANLHGRFTRPAKPFNKAQSQLFEGVKAVGALLGQTIKWVPSGGVCEGNNLFAAGLPNVDTLGVRGGDIHSENEFAWPESFVERAQLSALLLMKLADGTLDARGLRAAMQEA